METLIQTAISGLAIGAVYASLALALVLIYQTTGLINFAQAEMATFSTYVAWWLMAVQGVPYWAAFMLAMAAAFALGVIVERIFVRPIEDAPMFTIIGVFLALLVLIHTLTRVLFRGALVKFPTPFTGETSLGVSNHEIAVVGMVLVMVLLIWLFSRFTPGGLAMRAAALNPASARLLGIRVSRVLALGWGLAAMAGALAGIMVAPVLVLDVDLMGRVFIYAFAAALVGGLNNPMGAVLGGFIVGLGENLLGYFFGTDIRLTLALVLIIGIVTLKPAGLLGRAPQTRV